MKAKKILLLFSCIIICSCEGDKVDTTNGEKSLQLQAEIEGPKTRASMTSWEKDDAIGVYMVKAGQPLNSSRIRENVKYVTTGTSAFKPENEAEEITLPFDGTDVDFIGYYPYQTVIENYLFPIDLSNQSVQAKIDLMYSNNKKNANSINPNVVLQFTHQLSKVELKIQKDNLTKINDLSVILTNAGTNADFNLVNGTLSTISKRDNIQFKVSTDGLSAEAILLPEADLSGKELWFIIGENEAEVYKYPLTGNIEIKSFEKSTKYLYDVNLFTDKTVMVTESNITGWIDGPSSYVQADLTTEKPPLIKGSKKDPFTVMELHTNQDKLGVWVVGYIVGASTGSSINNFTSDLSLTPKTNIVMADNKNETDITKMIAVELPSGKLRDALNLNENPGNLNKKLSIKGNSESYYRTAGLKSPKEYEFIEP